MRKGESCRSWTRLRQVVQILSDVAVAAFGISRHGKTICFLADGSVSKDSFLMFFIGTSGIDRDRNFVSETFLAQI